MTTSEFLHELRRQDVRVWTEGDRLRVNAPRSVLTPELQAELAARKPEILSLFETAAARRSTLVPIQPSGWRPPFYGVPGHNGDVFCYVRLARELGAGQPFYALEPPGVDGRERPLTSVEDLAALFLRDLRAVQPEGPYYLGGFCLGGIVAFELARQLRAEGQEVALLALFESASPRGLRPWHRKASALRYYMRELAVRPWPERLAIARYVLARPLGRSNPPAAAPWWMYARSDGLRETALAAALAYARRPPSYPGRIVLFLGSEARRRLGYGRPLDWARVAAGGLEVNVGPDGCPGTVSMLFEPAYVRVFAQLLQRHLAQQPSRRS